MVIFSSHPSDFGDTPKKKNVLGIRPATGKGSHKDFVFIPSVEAWPCQMSRGYFEHLSWQSKKVVMRESHSTMSESTHEDSTKITHQKLVAPALTKEKKRKRSSLWHDVMMPWWSVLSTCLSVRSFRGSQPSHFIELPHPHVSFHLSSLELNPCLFQALCFRTNPFCGGRNSGCAEIPQLSATQDDVFHRKTQLPGHTSGKS